MEENKSTNAENVNVNNQVNSTQDTSASLEPTPQSDMEALLKNINEQTFEADPTLTDLAEENSVLKPTPQDNMKNLLTDINQTSLLERDAFEETRPTPFMPFDPSIQNQFIRRYKSHALFDELGFSPYRDNEALYNEKGNWGYEMMRAYNGFMNMVPLAMMDSLGISGLTNQGFASEFEETMAASTTSRGGVLGFATNLGLNSAYTVGIVAEMAVEEVLLGIAATAATSTGIGAGVGAGLYTLMGVRATRAANLIRKAFKIGDKLSDGIDAAQNVSKARKAFNSTMKALDKTLPGSNF